MGYILILFLGFIVLFVGAILFMKRALFRKGDAVTVYSTGRLVWRDEEGKCAIGEAGVSENKKEGDKTTPAGCFSIREVYYRPDRVEKPKTVFPTRALSEDDAWCDDPKDEMYNRLVKLPYKASHEELWREDEIYDVIAVLGYNDNPPVPGKGGAIFMHVARPGYPPTKGCVAVALDDLLQILEEAGENTRVCIKK